MTAILRDMTCTGVYQGRICGRTLFAYDPQQQSHAALAASVQTKCPRCGAMNGAAGVRTPKIAYGR